MEKQNSSQGSNFLAWMAQELGELKLFKPCAWYDKNFDWFICMNKDASYTEVTTSSPHLELFIENGTGKIVGFKVLGFSTLPAELSRRFVSMMDADEIRNIEEIWRINALELAPELDAQERLILDELLARN